MTDNWRIGNDSWLVLRPRWSCRPIFHDRQVWVIARYPGELVLGRRSHGGTSRLEPSRERDAVRDAVDGLANSAGPVTADRMMSSVGVPSAGQNRSKQEDLLGFLMNTLVLPSGSVRRSHLSRTAVQSQGNKRWRRLPIRDVPFEKLLEVLNPDQRQNHGLLFRVMFILNNAQSNFGEFDDLGTQSLP